MTQIEALEPLMKEFKPDAVVPEDWRDIIL